MPRNRLYRTQAIVLKRMDLGEADRILTLYTREHGKLRAVAKGIRRSTSRSAGHLEPFSLADVLLASGRELDVVSQADTVAAFRLVREDLARTSYAYYVAELTDALTEDRQENTALFELLSESLTALEEGVPPRLVILGFQLRLLALLGFRPELVECVICRATIQPGTNRFSAHLGGVVCPSCGPSEVSARPLGSDALKLLRYLQRVEGSASRTVRAPDEVSRESERMLRDYSEQIVERRFRSPQLIQRVHQAAARAGLGDE